MKRWLAGLLLSATIGSIAFAQQAPEPVHPAPHISPWPSLGTGQTSGMVQASMALGPELQRGRSAWQMLAERRKLDQVLASLQPQRKGTVDAYVVSVALDSDPVFSREAREAGRVLTRRYGAAGRAITLAGPDGQSADLPRGSITALTVVLARIAELMDPAEDVLVVYSTSHGMPDGLAYHDGDFGYGILSPYRLRIVLDELGIRRRIFLLSACYSGVFVPALASRDTAIVTAASAEATSFGCHADNDWTFFGDALINHALRKRVSLQSAANEAKTMIAGWEAGNGLTSSDPQIAIGEGVNAWLAALEARAPKGETAPVGAPAVNSMRMVTAALAAARSRQRENGR
jgi:hypothetical protein